MKKFSYSVLALTSILMSCGFSNDPAPSVAPVWAQEAYVKAVNNDIEDYFGWSIAVDGDVLVVGDHREDSDQTFITNGSGAPTDDNKDGSGAVFIFRRSGSSWVQEAYLKAVNADAQDYFGKSVAIDGDTIAVGAFMEDSGHSTVTNGPSVSEDDTVSSSGAVYIFRRISGVWTQDAYLKPSNPGINHCFGFSLALDGDTLVVGAYGEDSDQAGPVNGSYSSIDDPMEDSGAAYVFKRTGTEWAQEAYLKAANPDAGDKFGEDVSVSGDTIVVGARYESSNLSSITNGTGASPDNSSSWSGAAYVFKRNGSSWAQEAFLKAETNSLNDFFGSSVAVSGDTIAVGARGDASSYAAVFNGVGAPSDNTSGSSGAVYVFKRTASEWAHEAFLKASNNGAGDWLGGSVAMDGDFIAVGAIEEDSNQSGVTNGVDASADNSSSRSGAVYVYGRSGVSWSQRAYLKAANNGANDNFGWSLAISGDTIATGVYLEDSNQSTITNGPSASSDDSSADSGAAYIFRLR